MSTISSIQPQNNVSPLLLGKDEHLVVQKLQGKDPGLSTFASQHPALKSLTISYPVESCDFSKLFSQLQKIESLRKVSVSIQLFSETAAGIQPLSELTQLDALVLDMSGPRRNLIFDPLKKLIELKQLTIQGCATSKDTSKDLASLTKLRELSLAHGKVDSFPIPPKGVEKLTLAFADLGKDWIDETVLAQVMIQKLDLYGSNCTEEQVAKLVKLPKLTVLGVKHCQLLSREFIEKLRANNPKLVIVADDDNPHIFVSR